MSVHFFIEVYAFNYKTMEEFKFVEDKALVWVDAADVVRPPQLDYFYVVDTRPHAELLIKKNLVYWVQVGGFKVLRVYVDNGLWVVSSPQGAYRTISKPKTKGKVWIYRMPMKTKIKFEILDEAYKALRITCDTAKEAFNKVNKQNG